MNITHEDPSVYNGHYEVEVAIDRPIGVVWRQFLDIPSWVTSHHMEYVYGEPGTEGSIARVAFKKAKETDLPLPHHHYCKIIKVIPEQQWIQKTYAENGGSYGCQEFHTFDDGRVAPLNDHRTRVVFNLFAEIKAAGVTKDSAAINLNASRDGMQRNLENLQRIVEGR